MVVVRSYYRWMLEVEENTTLVHYPRPGDECSILAGIAHAGGKHDEGHATSLSYCHTY